MEHKILPRYPLGNPHRLWKQDNLVLSTFSVRAGNIRNAMETCKAAGFNMVELGWVDHEQAEEALRLAEELELSLLHQDFDAYGGMQAHKLERKLTRDEASAVVNHIRPWKRTVGYYVWDEPYVADQLAEARRQMDLFQALDPARLPFCVAIPSYNDKYTWQNGEFAPYLERYCTVVDPAMLSLDYYPIGLGWYTDEKQLDDSYMWLDLGLMRKLGKKYDMPIWFYYHGQNLYDYHRFTFPMVRMNMYAGLLYGAKGLQHYTAQGAVLAEDGTPGIFFEEQKTIHAQLRALGNTLMALDSRTVLHSPDLLPGCPHLEGLAETMADCLLLTGELPARTSAGEFEDSFGNQYLLVLNRDFEAGQTVTLTLQRPSRIYEVSKLTGRQSVLAEGADSITLTLDKGDAVLLRVQDANEEPFTLEYRLEK